MSLNEIKELAARYSLPKFTVTRVRSDIDVAWDSLVIKVYNTLHPLVKEYVLTHMQEYDHERYFINSTPVLNVKLIHLGSIPRRNDVRAVGAIYGGSMGFNVILTDTWRGYRITNWEGVPVSVPLVRSSAMSLDVNWQEVDIEEETIHLLTNVLRAKVGVPYEY